jgi:cysteine dioxygenase
MARYLRQKPETAKTRRTSKAFAFFLLSFIFQKSILIKTFNHHSEGIMKEVSIEQFISGLCCIPKQNFGIGTVYDYLKAHPVDSRSLEPYLFFSPRFYTRNLIFKNNVFELLSLCWESGHVSRIHNHDGQNCWMTVPIGKLRIQNFRVVRQNHATGECDIEPSDSIDIHRSLAAEVDPAEPVHQVLNLPEFGQRAVSLHIYSKPYDHCLIYSPDHATCKDVELHYTSEFGKLCQGQLL